MILHRLARSNFIIYQCSALFLYLIIITITESMDFILPLYIILCVFPLLKTITTIDYTILIYIGINLVYLIIGLLFQDFRESLITFFTRIFQFICIFLFVYNSNYYNKRIDIKKILKIAIYGETILGVYLFIINLSSGDFTTVRIIAGRQPVGGNISIALLPLFIWSYYNEKKYQKRIIWTSIYLLIWVFISGTRGYMLLFGLGMLTCYIDYFVRHINNRIRNSMFMKIIILGIIIFIIIINFTVIDNINSNLIINTLRLEEGIGSRTLENQLSASFFQNTTFMYKLFGIGFGGKTIDTPGYYSAFQSTMGNMASWAYYKYANSIGTTFHNYFYNLLLLQGITGIILIIMVFFWGLSKVKHCNYSCVHEKRAYYLYWIGFFIMNAFRWSCDCGIAEMIIFGIVLSGVCSTNTKVLSDRRL